MVGGWGGVGWVAGGGNDSRRMETKSDGWFSLGSFHFAFPAENQQE